MKNWFIRNVSHFLDENLMRFHDFVILVYIRNQNVLSDILEREECK